MVDRIVQNADTNGVNAEIIAIGTELLLGFILNEDTVILSRALAESGIDCHHHVTVGDNPQRLKSAIQTALGRSDLVLTCGGLGPTVDDITLETIAQATGGSLSLDAKLLKQVSSRFTDLGRKLPKSARREAFLPEGARAFPNQVGTAPGFMMKMNAHTSEHLSPPQIQKTGIHSFTHSPILVALPGPPRELSPMVEKQLIPFLRKLKAQGDRLESRTLKTTGLPEPDVDKKVQDLLKLTGDVTVGIYASPGQVVLRITSKGKSTREALKKIRPVERKIRSRFKKDLFGADDDTLESVVVGLLKKKKGTLAIAESCTGGLTSHRITDVPGASRIFRGGVVAYSNNFKQTALEIPAALIQRSGAVSEPVAKAMAGSIRKKTGAAFGIGITGIAGPTGSTPAKPVGLVFIALATAAGVHSQKHRFSGTREMVKLKAAQAALNMLRLHLI